MATTVILSIGNRPAEQVNILSVSANATAGYQNAWRVNIAAPTVNIAVGDKLVSSTRSYAINEINNSYLIVTGDPFTTTLAPTTGLSATSRAFYNGFETLKGWIAACPRNLVVKDWVWAGEIYNEGQGANGEWDLWMANILDVDGLVTNETCGIKLSAAPGCGFIDKLKTNNLPIRYDPSYGVAIKYSGNYNNLFFTQNVDFTLRGVMINRLGNTAPFIIGSGTGVQTRDRVIVENCIVNNARVQVAVRVVNSVIYTNGRPIAKTPTLTSFYNCTLINTGVPVSFVPGYDPSYVTKIINCAILGFSELSGVPATTQVPPSTNIATDLSTTDPAIPNSLYSIDPANQFNSLVFGAEDISLKPGSSLINAGSATANQYTNSVDIGGRPRNQVTPSIGAAEEAWYPITPTVLQSDQTISKGIARGIERGIV